MNRSDLHTHTFLVTFCKTCREDCDVTSLAPEPRFLGFAILNFPLCHLWIFNEACSKFVKFSIKWCQILIWYAARLQIWILRLVETDLFGRSKPPRTKFVNVDWESTSWWNNWDRWRSTQKSVALHAWTINNLTLIFDAGLWIQTLVRRDCVVLWPAHARRSTVAVYVHSETARTRLPPWLHRNLFISGWHSSADRATNQRSRSEASGGERLVEQAAWSAAIGSETCHCPGEQTLPSTAKLRGLSCRDLSSGADETPSPVLLPDCPFFDQGPFSLTKIECFGQLLNIFISSWGPSYLGQIQKNSSLKYCVAIGNERLQQSIPHFRHG